MSTVDETPVTTVSEASEAFLAHLRFKRRSKGTIAQYEPVLRALNALMGGRDVDSIKIIDLETFISLWIAQFEIRNGRQPSSSALKNTVVTVKGMFTYLHNYGLLPKNPTLVLDPPKVEQKTNDWLKADEDEALLATPMNEDEMAIVWFLRWTGLRVSEALGLRIQT